jgi:hypothetical protein
VDLGHHAVELARIRDARAPVGELRGAPRGLERGELAAVEDRRRVGRRAEPRDPHRLRARGEDQRGRAVADRRAVLAAQRRGNGQVRARVEVGGERLGPAVERRERVVRAERVRAVHQAREHLVLAVLVESELAEPRLRDQRDQRGHREAEAALLGVDRLREDRGGHLGVDRLHALAAEHEHALGLARRDLVVGLVQRRRARRRRGLERTAGMPVSPSRSTTTVAMLARFSNSSLSITPTCTASKLRTEESASARS